MAGSSNLGEVKRTPLVPPFLVSEAEIAGTGATVTPDWLLILLVGFGLYIILVK